MGLQNCRLRYNIYIQHEGLGVTKFNNISQVISQSASLSETKFLKD